MVTDRDNFIYHEMMAHTALFTHAQPKKVVIIGGGDCGTLHEVLKHDSVQQVVQIEIDQRVTQLSEQYFPQLCRSNQDPRAQFYFGDGVQWIEQAADHSIDCLIIDSTDPVGIAEGLFGAAFLQQCYRVLAAGGVLVQHSESPFYHTQSVIEPLHQALQHSGFSSVATLPFPQPIYPSGWWSCTLSAKQGDVHQFRSPSVQNRFTTQYYNAAIHQAAFALPTFMHQAMRLS